MIVISPHLDDAVFSVGQIIAAHPGAAICTPLAGLPAPGLLTAYDKSAGYVDSAASVTDRRAEDVRASLVLGATAVHGDWLDGQYVVPPDHGEVIAWLTEQMRGEDAILIPFGIQHPDHELVRSLAWSAADALTAPLYLYEELPYRIQYPEMVASLLPTMGAEPGHLPSEPDDRTLSLKRAACECYRSQLNDFMRRTIYVPERVWRVR